jgi:hypothetical protein
MRFILGTGTKRNIYNNFEDALLNNGAIFYHLINVNTISFLLLSENPTTWTFSWLLMSEYRSKELSPGSLGLKK